MAFDTDLEHKFHFLSIPDKVYTCQGIYLIGYNVSILSEQSLYHIES